jgi:hypothetical protein
MYAMAMDGGAHGVSLDPTSQEPAIVSPNPVFGSQERATSCCPLSV